MKMSQRLDHVQASATMALNERVKAMQATGRKIFNLTAGEPDLPTPSNIRKAAIQFLESGYIGYTAVAGIERLRRSLAEDLSRRFGMDISEKEIIVTAGAKQGLYNCFMALLDPGHEVIIPTPAWVSYAEQVRLAGGQPVFIETGSVTGFFPVLEQIERARTAATRALILNTPNNPTGQVIDANMLDAIVRWCMDHEIFLVFDETYALLTYPDAVHVHPVEVEMKSRPWVVTVNSFSKAYRMTGWRIGWTWARPEIINAMATIQGHSTSNAMTVSQWAAVAALHGGTQEALDTASVYAQRAAEFTRALNNLPSIHALEPRGAFYVWADISVWASMLGLDDPSFSLRLIEKAGVAGVPGSAFHSPGYIRFSIACDEETRQGAMEAIENFYIQVIEPLVDTRPPHRT